MLGGLPRDRPEPAGASPDRPAKRCRTARADSFGTRTGRGPGGAIAAVTVRHSPRPTIVSGISLQTLLPGPVGGRTFCGVSAGLPSACGTLKPPRRWLPASAGFVSGDPGCTRLRGYGYFAEFVRGLGLHTFGLSGGRARSSGCAALRID